MDKRIKSRWVVKFTAAAAIALLVAGGMSNDTSAGGGNNMEIGGVAKPQLLLAGKTATVPLEGYRKLSTATAACPTRLVITTGDPKIPANEIVLIRVYLTEGADQRARSTDDPEFVGTFGFFPTVPTGRNRIHSLKLNNYIKSNAKNPGNRSECEFDGDKTVTLVMETLNPKKNFGESNVQILQDRLVP